MTVTALTTTTPAPAWTALRDIPADHNPALVYLASLGSPAAVRPCAERAVLGTSSDNPAMQAAAEAVGYRIESERA
jgi:hypothetical protein